MRCRLYRSNSPLDSALIISEFASSNGWNDAQCISFFQGGLFLIQGVDVRISLEEFDVWFDLFPIQEVGGESRVGCGQGLKCLDNGCSFELNLGRVVGEFSEWSWDIDVLHGIVFFMD